MSLNSTTSESPTWSVMIPVYNRTRYLTAALDSVVAQAFDRGKMQIEVIDNCSTENDVIGLIKTRYGDRISVYRQPKPVSMAENWNACIERARGALVHILHDDDFVTNGYYTEIESLAHKYPSVNLYATRNFVVDEESIITGVSGRIRELEKPTKAIDSFLYQTPIQCAAVTVRRTAYEALGGFRLDMGFVIDCEMWARVTSSCGAILSPKVLASYRIGDDTDTARLVRTGDNVRDLCRLYEIHSKRYPEFSPKEARQIVFWMAWNQYTRFKILGDEVSAAANYRLWHEVTPLRKQLTWQLWQLRKATGRYVRWLFSLPLYMRKLR